MKKKGFPIKSWAFRFQKNCENRPTRCKDTGAQTCNTFANTQLLSFLAF